MVSWRSAARICVIQLSSKRAILNQGLFPQVAVFFRELLATNQYFNIDGIDVRILTSMSSEIENTYHRYTAIYDTNLYTCLYCASKIPSLSTKSYL